MLSTDALASTYRDEGTRAKLRQMYALSTLFRRGIRISSFTPSPTLDSAIKLSSDGEKALTMLHERWPGSLEAVDRFALFARFAHNQLLVDINTTDADAIASELAATISAGKIRYPWMFGHDLYDCAFSFREVRDELTAEQASTLLGIKPGVCQMANYLVGPFGLINSAEMRALQPQRALPLWHCSNPSCAGIHTALVPQDDAAADAIVRAEIVLEEAEGVASEWEGFFRGLVFRDMDSYYDDFGRIELPWFLGNVFSEGELRRICKVLLVRSGSLRSRFANGHRAFFSGTSEEVAERLSGPQALQLLLAAADSEIIAVVDECVDSGEISIPSTEKRKSPTDFAYGTWADTHFECSRLGLRIVGDEEHAGASARLKRLIKTVYREESDAKQLGWRLRNVPGATVGHKLEEFISSDSPKEILRQFVFVSEEKLRTALNHVRAPHLFRPDFDEESLLRKVLWRIGYEDVEFESPLISFFEGIRDLRAASGSPLSGAAWREKVRSSGVNLFVYLEDVLDRSLSFATWVLLGDHFENKHRYSAGYARDLVALHLSRLVTGKEGEIVFDRSGKDTLFPLICGFAALRIRCEAVLSEPPSKYERHGSSRPHWDTTVTLQMFPYKHTAFVLDLPQEERDICLAFIQSVHDRLMQGVVMSVRNRIDHSGGSFPTSDEISKCCETLETIGRELRDFGIFPTIYSSVEVKRDLDDRTKVSSRDSQGTEIEWTPSPLLHAVHSLPEPELPQVIVPKLHVPETAEPLRFQIVEPSEFKVMWAGYPKRRQLSPTEMDLLMSGADGEETASTNKKGVTPATEQPVVRRRLPARAKKRKAPGEPAKA